jgi:diacylglycerol kinase (ATP)
MTQEQHPQQSDDSPKQPASEGKTRRRIRRLISGVRGVFSRHKKDWIMVVLNPAAGQGTPDLRLINRVIHDAGYDWEVEVTNQFGDGARLARHAVERGAKVVAAYGGDGTILDVATGLLGTQTPLAILPGGTGNALARELLVPFDLAGGCALLVDRNAAVRSIDLGMANNQLFLLRFGVGLEAEITRVADRAQKDRMGALAYVSATVQAWNQANISRYRLRMDGERVIEIEGLACMVANAGTLGVPGLAISPQVRIDDGLLDVFVIRRADLAELGSLAASMMGSQAPEPNRLPHWQCKTLAVEADPPQGIEADGEHLGMTPANVSLIPGAIRVIVPKAFSSK